MLVTTTSVAAPSRKAEGGVLAFTGVMMPPRPTLEPDDLMTPSAASVILRVPVNRLRVWIHRSGEILGRKVEPVGHLGRWPAYDFNDLAALDAAMRARHRTEAASAEAA